MNKQIITITVSALIGFGAGYIIFKQIETPGEVGMSSIHQANMSPATMHKEVEVDKTQSTPTVTVNATPDSKDGYNLKIDVANFTFTPDKAGKANEPNTGHAHIYINNEKLGRLYGTWFYLPSKYLKEGENKVKITLNSNDHSDWVVNGEHIESTVTVIK